MQVINWISCPHACAGILLAALLSSSAAQAMLNVSGKPTQNMDCNEGLCTATAADAVLNVKDVANMLAADDLDIRADSPAVNIKITAPFTWTSRHRLTLTAAQSVIVGAAVTAAGRSAITIKAMHTQPGGDIAYLNGGSISFWDLGSRLTINGVGYILVDDLRILADDIAANPSGRYALAKNYDASQLGTLSHSPIPTPFSGTFLGLGHGIANLSISSSDSNVGLFSELDSAGGISGLLISNLSLTGGDSIGGLAGLNSGTIRSISVTGLIIGGEYAGGILGDNVGQLADCRADVTVSGGTDGGGIAGDNWSGATISGCHSSGSITGAWDAGGVAGLSYGSIDTSSSTASIVGGQVAGGLVGVGGNIYESYATGNVTTPKGKLDSIRLGGLVGWLMGYVSNSYAIGNVSVHSASASLRSPANASLEGKKALGGLVGLSYYSSVSTVYSIGNVPFIAGYYSGGLLGFDSSNKRTADAAYWDLDTSGVIDPGKGAGNIVYDSGIRGLSNPDMHKVPAGFSYTLWAQNPKINNGYPYLKNNPPQ